ncbi:sialidase family protein [Streptomyces oceani]|uniref:sialidase family protein n=1 Tax=Streptomyces oceani TaxID=1075402 RepID=UPI001112CECC|nr:sialidase family protein [Streptomyces oceani]
MTRKRVHAWLGGGATVAVVVTALTSTAQADTRGLSARVSADCTNGKLQVILSNRSDAEHTFKVAGPEDGTTASRTLAAGDATTLEWTRDQGSAYTIKATTDSGFSKSESGELGCGLGANQPGMNTTELFSTKTRFKGLVDENGQEYTGTAKSVRIPSMAVTNNGTVLAATDARVESSGDLGGDNNIQIGLRRSTDQGKTWSDPTIAAHGENNSIGTADSSLLVDRQTNRVFLFYNEAKEGVGYWTPEEGSGSNDKDDPKSIHVKYVTSDDNGASWSEPRDLNPDVKDPKWKGLFASSGHGIQTSGGRLIQPLVYRSDAGGNAVNIYSDDNGKTWKTGSTAGSGFNEHKAIERGNGDIEQNMRSDTESKRYYAESKDGSSEFSEPWASSLIDPKVNADEISYLQPDAEGVDPSTKAPRRTGTALFSNPASTSAREDLTVRLSEDDGRSYPDSALLRTGEAGYSTMAVLDDGSVGNLYERGNDGGIYFSRFTLDWLRGS